jgi:hypothetical protein
MGSRANETWLTTILSRGRDQSEVAFAGDPIESARFLVGALEGSMLLARTIGGTDHFRASAGLWLEVSSHPPCFVMPAAWALEGVVSKLGDAPYRSGRGKAWMKSKCSNRQEFVFRRDQLAYAGRVGTGFSNQVAADLFRPLTE